MRKNHKEGIKGRSKNKSNVIVRRIIRKGSEGKKRKRRSEELKRDEGEGRAMKGVKKHSIKGVGGSSEITKYTSEKEAKRGVKKKGEKER